MNRLFIAMFGTLGLSTSVSYADNVEPGAIFLNEQISKDLWTGLNVKVLAGKVGMKKSFVSNDGRVSISCVKEDNFVSCTLRKN